MNKLKTITKYQIERYSPGRKKWIHYAGELWTDEQAAINRVETLNFNHKRLTEGIKFRYKEVSLELEKKQVLSKISESQSLQTSIAKEIAKLKIDPIKDKIKTLTKKKKAHEKVEKILTDKLTDSP